MGGADEAVAGAAALWRPSFGRTARAFGEYAVFWFTKPNAIRINLNCFKNVFWSNEKNCSVIRGRITCDQTHLTGPIHFLLVNLYTRVCAACIVRAHDSQLMVLVKKD